MVCFARHGGKLEGVAGEAWNVVGKYVRATGVSVCEDNQYLQKQKGLLLLYSDDGLKSVSEFLVYFSLVVAAELVRLVERSGDDDDYSDYEEEEEDWVGLSVATTELCASVLPEKMAHLMASFSVECSDAITFLVAHRESLFTLEVSALLPSSQMLSSLRRRVADCIGALSEQDRVSQEANLLSLRNSWLSKRICLGTQSFGGAVSRRVACCFSTFGSATHLSLQFTPISSDKPIFLTVLVDGKCVFDRLQLAVLLWPRDGVYVIKVSFAQRRNCLLF
jgi:hypothetical protein